MKMNWYNRDEIKKRVHIEMIKTAPKVDLEPSDLEHVEIPTPILPDKNWDQINYLKKQHSKNYNSKIENGEWVFKGEYRMAGKYGGPPDVCPHCGCKWGIIVYTPKLTHHAQLICRDCGHSYKWLKKN